MHILYTVQTQPVSETTGLKLILALLHLNNNFPGGSDGKESACSVGDPGQYLGWEDPLEEDMTTHSSILAWRIPWTEDLAGYSSWGGKESDTTERLTLSLSRCHI